MRRVIVTTGMLVFVVAAGCGGGSSGSSGSAIGATPGATPDASSAAQINLQQSDVPAGWEARPNAVTSTANARGEAALYACLGTPPPEAHTTANANSPAFVGTASQASSNVKFTHTLAQSEADYATLTKPGAADCARNVLTSSLPGVLPAGSSVAAGTVNGVPVSAPSGDQATGTLVTVNVNSPGGHMTVYAEFTTIQRGRALVAVQTIGLGTPFSVSLQQSIVSNVENRASQVPAS